MRFRQSPDLLFSRGEPEDPRMGDVVKMPSVQEFAKDDWDLTLVGLPDDRGVLLNKGRPGAKEGPQAIRKWFYRLVAPSSALRVADLGDLEMTRDLHHDHESAAQAIAFGLTHSARVAILGGGHDWGFSPLSALMKTGRTGFINFDAHLDVRPSEAQHSGTSYWRALEKGICGEDAVWYGVQTSSLASLHCEYVKAKGGRIFFEGGANRGAAFKSAVAEIVERCDAVDVSLDLDVFSMAEAPGVSAPQPTGLYARELLPLVSFVLGLPKVRTFGIYELSPPNDVAEATARLAARCLWEACIAKSGL